MRPQIYATLICFFLCNFAELSAQIRLSPKASALKNWLLQNQGALIAQNKKVARLDSWAQERFQLSFREGQYWASGLLELSNPQNLSLFPTLEIASYAKVGNIYSLQIPLCQFIAFSELPIKGYFCLDALSPPLLDSLRKDLRLQELEQASPLPLQGEGVLLGIIDVGFDLRHPTFRSLKGERYRILKLWDQKDTLGPKPERFAYGSEYSGQSALRALAQDFRGGSHGTHVAAIAGGSSYGCGPQYRGVAPESDFLFVSCGFKNSEILDAVAYLISQARALNRPIVINMSFGGFNEAMDGNSLLEKALTQIAEDSAGVVLVAAAGNSAYKDCFLEKKINPGQIIYTLPALQPYSLNNIYQFSYTNITLLGEKGDAIHARLYALDSLGNPLYSTPWLYSEVQSQKDTFLLLTSGDTLFYSFYTDSALAINRRPAIYITLWHKTPYLISLACSGSPGSTLYLWNVGPAQGLPLSNKLPKSQQPLPGYYAGGKDRTILTPGSARGVITVGAHTTKNSYRQIDGTFRSINLWAPHGEIAPFSSRGPTLDGRIKPDLTAPGNVVASALASKRTGANPVRFTDRFIVDKDTALFGIDDGTSMSTPAVSGVAALILQNVWLSDSQKEKWNTLLVGKILKDAARKDEFTGSLGPEGSPLWGSGKLDALRAWQLSNQEILLREEQTLLQTLVIYPNPATTSFTLLTPSFWRGAIRLYLINPEGKLIWSSQIEAGGNNEFSYTLPALPLGLYFLNIQTNHGKTTRKLIIAY
jgi:subtilisin family serine protease